MKYITLTEFGWDHRPYWEYLKTVRNSMPKALHAFASDASSHDLQSPNSLHDTWLEHWTVKEHATNGNDKKRNVSVECCLLGQRHDRHIRLNYTQVAAHGVLLPENEARCVANGHGDLLVHELRAARDDLFIHELQFSSGALYFVEFRGFGHTMDTSLQR